MQPCGDLKRATGRERAVPAANGVCERWRCRQAVEQRRQLTATEERYGAYEDRVGESAATLNAISDETGHVLQRGGWW